MIKNTITCARVLAAAAFFTLLGATDSFGAAYVPGTVAIKPLNFNVTSLVSGFKNPDSKVVAPGNPEIKVDSFRTPLSFGFNSGDRNGWTYGLELAVMLGWDLELLARFGYSHERPVQRYQAGQRAFDFDPRHNFHGSLGLRRYFELQNAFVPFIGVTGGFVSQGKTTADVYARGPFALDSGGDVFISNSTLLNRKTLGTFELHVGTDYKFSDLWVLSVSVAARYIQSGSSMSYFSPAVATAFGGAAAGTVRYTDNKQNWHFPLTISLKITL